MMSMLIDNAEEDDAHSVYTNAKGLRCARVACCDCGEPCTVAIPASMPGAALRRALPFMKKNTVCRTCRETSRAHFAHRDAETFVATPGADKNPIPTAVNKREGFLERWLFRRAKRSLRAANENRVASRDIDILGMFPPRMNPDDPLPGVIRIPCSRCGEPCPVGIPAASMAHLSPRIIQKMEGAVKCQACRGERESDEASNAAE